MSPAIPEPTQAPHAPCLCTGHTRQPGGVPDGAPELLAHGGGVERVAEERGDGRREGRGEEVRERVGRLAREWAAGQPPPPVPFDW